MKWESNWLVVFTRACYRSRSCAMRIKIHATYRAGKNKTNMI